MLLRRPMSVATLEIVADITWVSTEFLSQTAETCPARCCIYFSRPSYPNVVNFSVVFHNIIRRWTNHSAPRQSCSQSESPGPGLCDDSWQSRVHTKPPTSTQQYVVPRSWSWTWSWSRGSSIHVIVITWGETLGESNKKCEVWDQQSSSHDFKVICQKVDLCQARNMRCCDRDMTWVYKHFQ